MKKTIATFLVATSALLLWGAVAASALEPAGPNFRISTTGSDSDASRNADGLATDNEFEIFGQLVGANGAAIGVRFPISTTGTDRDASRPAVTYDSRANEYLVVWEADDLATDDEFEIFGQLLSASGAEIGSDFQISNIGAGGGVGPEGFEPAVSYNAADDDFLVVWEGGGLLNPSKVEIFGQILDADGAESGSAFRVSKTGGDGDATRNAVEPALAYDSAANDYLVTWGASGLVNAAKFEITGQLISATGTKIGLDFRISHTGDDGDGQRDALRPAIAYDPKTDEYLVVWAGNSFADPNKSEISGQFVSASGIAIGSNSRISTTGSDDGAREASEPAIAYNSVANEFLVTWTADGLPIAGEFEIFGQQLSSAGEKLDSPVRISTTGSDGDAFEPAIAYNSVANEFLVTWFADALPTDNKFEIFGQRLATPPTPPPPPPTAKCAGKPATLIGTPGADKLKGTSKRDVIAALGGKDTVRGLDRNDIVCGGPGNDRLLGGKGNDQLRGEAGADRLAGGLGNDKLQGGKGRDVLIGGKGKDKLAGGAGEDKQSQ
jgi:Ca2+-binding RTX toxin-like protein